MTTSSPLDLLRVLEATEANLAKLERVWKQISSKIPNGTAFGGDSEYDELRRTYADLVAHLPAIDGWRIEDSTEDLNTIGLWRFDASEVGEPEAALAVEEAVEKPGKDIAEYRFRFDRKRRGLVRAAVESAVADFDGQIESLSTLLTKKYDVGSAIPVDELEALRGVVTRIDTLLGSSVKRPGRWSDLRRHLHFGQLGDLSDIITVDWPTVKPELASALYGEDDPLPIDVSDLSELLPPQPDAVIPVALAWDQLSAEGFERLLFGLLAADEIYQNPQWLMHTNASDRGRDLSAQRITRDSMSGMRVERVIVQCKHWLGRSVGVTEVSVLKNQIRHWEPPRINILAIATTGRFSADAVQWIEQHNQSDSALRIEMWPGSHLERLLAARPDLIAEFGLR